MKITRKSITASERTERDTMLQKAINIQNRHWKDGAKPDTRSEEYKKFKKDCDYRGVDAESIWNEAYNVRKDLRKAEASKSTGRKNSINAAESYGWVVGESEAWEAYEFACEYFGKEDLDAQIVSSLSVDELASSLAYIFRMNEFQAWYEYSDGDIVESRKLRGKRAIKSSKRNTRRPVMAMRLTRDFSEFRPWSGAVDTWNTLADYDKLDVLESILDTTFIDENGEGIMSETELNDLLWFEPETVYEWVGLYYNEETGEVSDEPFDEDDEEDEDEGIEESTKIRGKKSVTAAYGGWGKFYGLDDVEFTVPNDTDDPTIFYNDNYYNYYDIEDTLWSYYKEECEDNGTTPDEDEFERWVADNSYLVYDTLDTATPKTKRGRGVYRR